MGFSKPFGEERIHSPAQRHLTVGCTLVSADVDFLLPGTEENTLSEYGKERLDFNSGVVFLR